MQERGYFCACGCTMYLLVIVNYDDSTDFFVGFLSKHLTTVKEVSYR